MCRPSEEVAVADDEDDKDDEPIVGDDAGASLRESCVLLIAQDDILRFGKVAGGGCSSDK